MAKQNVTFFERHVEKIVVGVAGGVLVAIIVLYGIGSPNKVNVDGTAVGPNRFYEHLGELAKQAGTKIQNGTLQPVPAPPRLTSGPDQNVYKMAHLVLADLGPYLPPTMLVPSAIDPGSVGQLELARILAPKAITVREGRGAAVLPPTQYVAAAMGATTAGQPMDVSPVPVDHSWTIILAALDRKAQREAFKDAKYDQSKQLIVADVQAERQELQPNGQWGPSQLVHGYTPLMITAEPRVEMIVQDGQKVIADTDRRYLDDFRALLYSAEGQNRVLRPEFQQFLKAPLVWAPPRKLTGFDFELASYGVTFPLEGVKPVGPRPVGPIGNPMAPQPPRMGPADVGVGRAENDAKKKIKELMKQGTEAIDKKDYIRATELLQQVCPMTTPQDKDCKESIRLLQAIEPEVVRSIAEKEKRDKINQNLGMQELGKDQEPMWLTDVGVEPGHSYRYRVRLIAFNDYAGKFSLLKETKDAEQVLLTGEWSTWTDPVTITPMVQAFFTDARDAVNGGGRLAHLQIYHFNNGKWNEEGHDYEVGQQVAYKNGLQNQNYDGIVASIEADRPYRARNKAVLVADLVPTDVLTLVSAAGLVDERYAAEDKLRQRTFSELVKKEKELAASQGEAGSGLRPGYVPMANPGGPPMMDPRMGGRMPPGMAPGMRRGFQGGRMDNEGPGR